VDCYLPIRSRRPALAHRRQPYSAADSSLGFRRS